ncbi:MAG: hypothetical protein WCF31_03115 [Candidatus Deferrimicrobiaceae bacterium]
MMKGFRRAELRCRKCGATIAVLTPATTSRTPAAKVPGDRPGGALPHPRRDKEHPLVERQDPSAEHARPGLTGGEGKTQTSTALAEETNPAEPVPDNVYTLDSFRGGHPKKLPAGGYDISGSILPHPPASAAPRESVERSPAVAESLEELRSIRSSLPEEAIHWREEDIASKPSEAPLASPDKMPVSGKSPANKSRRPGRFSLSKTHRVTHIAIIYFLLLFLGGFGYLLVRFFSHMIHGEGV